MEKRIEYLKQHPGKLRADVTGHLVRNERGRLRIGEFEVIIHLSDLMTDIKYFDRCAKEFEYFCVVTQSLRQGIPTTVKIVNGDGQEVYASDGSISSVAPAKADNCQLCEGSKTN